MKKAPSTLGCAFTVIIFLLFAACGKDNDAPAWFKLTVSGTVADCGGSLVDKGYVTILADGISHKVSFDKGTFTATIYRHDTAAVPVKITPFDLKTKIAGVAVTLTADTGVLDAGWLQACQYDQQVTYAWSVDYSPIDQITYSSNNGTLIHGQRAYSFGPDIYIHMPLLTGTGPYTMDSLYVYINSAEGYKGYGLSCTITAFGPVGGYIRGTYTGITRLNNGSYDTNPPNAISGSFVVKRTQ